MHDVKLEYYYVQFKYDIQMFIVYLQLQFNGSVVWFGSNHSSVYPSKVLNWN